LRAHECDKQYHNVKKNIFRVVIGTGRR
jgi:hypothetical protein